MPVVSETDQEPAVLDYLGADIAFVAVDGELEGYRKCLERQPANRPATRTGWAWYVQIPPGFSAAELRRIADDMDVRKRATT